MAQKPPIRPLAKRDFSTEEFEEALRANLERKRLREEPDWEDITPVEEEPDWEEITPIGEPSIAAESDISSYKPEGSAEKSLARKAIDFMVEPLTTKPSEYAREISQDWDLPTKEGRVHPLAAFGRGAMEGLGDVVSSFTSPASIIATLAGGGAVAAGRAGFAPVANTLRRITQAASIPNVIHGGETVLDSDKSLTERALGLTELAGGAAGVHFPKSAIAPHPKRAKVGDTVKSGNTTHQITGVDERGRPKTRLILPDEPAGDVPLIPTEKATAADAARIDELSNKVQNNTATPQEIAELAEHFDDMFGVTPPSRPPSAEAQAASQSIESPAPTPAEPDIVDKLFPEMTNRQSKRAFTFDQAPDELNAPEPRQKGRPPITFKDVDAFLRDEEGSADFSRFFQGEEDLGYSNRTNDPDTVDLGELSRQDIDLNAAALEAGSETARPVNRVSRFLQDESGELDLSALMPERRRDDTPVEYAFDWPDFHEDGRPERMFNVMAGPDRGSTISESTLRERGVRIPESNVNMPPEFSPDILQTNHEVYGGTSPKFAERGSPEFNRNRLDELYDRGRSGQLTGDELSEARDLNLEVYPERRREPSFTDRVRNFMADESGEIRFDRNKPQDLETLAAENPDQLVGTRVQPKTNRVGNHGIIAKIKRSQGIDWGLVAIPDERVGYAPMSKWHPLFNLEVTPNEPSGWIPPEFRRVEESRASVATQAANDLSATPRNKIQEALDRVNEARAKRGMEPLDEAKTQSFIDRFKTTLADETGSIPRRPKDQSNLWETLPEHVKNFFQERGAGPEDFVGVSLKDISDTYNAALETIKSQEAALPVSAAKQAQLVKKSGERVAAQPQLNPNVAFGPEGDIAPIIEAKRKLDLGTGSADFKYKALLPESMQYKLSEGETFKGRLEGLIEASSPFTPEMNAELAAFKQSFEASPDRRMQKYTEGIPEQPDRRGIPLLRRKSLPERLKGLLGDESGEIDLSRILGEDSAIGNFLRDESGEIRFDIPPTKPKAGAPRIKLLGEESLNPDLPVQRREAPKFEEPSMFRKAMDLPIGMMSVDAPYMTSAAFRQASPLAWTKEWFDAWGPAARAYGSEAAAEAIENEIRNSEFFKPRYKPNYDVNGNIKSYKELPSIAESLGVRMTDFKHITSREEMIRSQWAEKFPWVKKSNRAYSAFLNSLRKAQFEKLMHQADWAGEGAKDFVTAKRIAEFINDATGRSTLKTDLPFGKKLDFERNADDLAKVLWSPRLLASRVKFLNPMTYINTEPQIRQQYINGLLRSVGTWWAFAGMASMLGDQLGKNVSISTDVSNADFGKIRIGDTRIDPGAGFQQLLVFGARMAPQIEGLDTGKFTSSTTGKITNYGEGFKPRTRWDTALDFGASKLHPMAKVAYDLLRATKDRPVHLGDRAVEMMLPLMTQDIMATFESDPDLALAIAPLSSIGMGATTYDRGSFNEPSFTNNIEEYLGMRPGSLAGTVGR